MRFFILFLLILSASAYSCESQEKVLCIAAFEYKPFVDPESEHQGYISQVMVEAFALQGYDAQLKYMPLKRALYEAQLGNVDGILGAYYTEERSEYLMYSKPITDIAINFFALTDSDYDYDYDLATVKELLLTKVSVLRGTSLSQKLLDDGFLVEESVDNIASLNKLLHKRVGLVAGTTEWILHDLHSNFSAEQVGRIKILYPDYQVNSLNLTLSRSRKDAKDLINVFNKGLGRLKKSGRYHEIQYSAGVNAQ